VNPPPARPTALHIAEAQRLLREDPELSAGRFRLFAVALCAIALAVAVWAAALVGLVMAPRTPALALTLATVAAAAMTAGVVLLVWTAVRAMGNRSRVAVSLASGQSAATVAHSAPALVRSSVSRPLLVSAILFVVVAGAVGGAMLYADATRADATRTDASRASSGHSSDGETRRQDSNLRLTGYESVPLVHSGTPR
jgi:hypothetical protein